jgi:hypothetical protein
MNNYLETADEGFQLLRMLPWLTLLVIFAPLFERGERVRTIYRRRRKTVLPRYSPRS